MQNEKIKVMGMTCQHCKVAVEKAVQNEGVNEVEVNLTEGTVRVVYDEKKISRQQIEKSIEESGYEVKR